MINSYNGWASCTQIESVETNATPEGVYLSHSPANLYLEKTAEHVAAFVKHREMDDSEAARDFLENLGQRDEL